MGTRRSWERASRPSLKVVAVLVVTCGFSFALNEGSISTVAPCASRTGASRPSLKPDMLFASGLQAYGVTGLTRERNDPWRGWTLYRIVLQRRRPLHFLRKRD